MSEVHTDVAIIGGGPVGLSAAAMLGHLGISCVLHEQNETTSFHPRGHVVNTRTMEIFRGLGVAAAVDEVSLPLERHAGIGFVTSLAGDEIGVIETRGNPEWARIERQQSAVFKRSCPQDVLEPVLRQQAEACDSVETRFGHRITGIEQDATGVTLGWETTGGATGQTRAKYLIAADGPRSFARDSVGIGMKGRSIGQQIGVYFHADLWSLVEKRPYLLYWIYNATTSGVLISLDGRTRWTYNFGYGETESREDFTQERCLDILRAVIGDPSIPIEIKNVMPWRMQARIADTMSSGRVFMAGDAAHPLPPTGGQGMNTGVADVQNLVWKLNLVLRGSAPESLLDTYDIERRPVATFNVEQSARNAEAMVKKGLSGMLANESELLSNLEGPEGAANRAKLAEGIPEQRAHFDYPGQTFGYHYASALITPDGTALPDFSVTEYRPTARPGHRAPHLPLGNDPDTSLLDTFDIGHFTLLAGPDGQDWADTAISAAQAFDVPLKAYRVGAELDTDVDAWTRQYGVSAQGAVLVRPDGHVAWRSPGPGRDTDLTDALAHAIARTETPVSA
ncbi:FAD-dependent monooxygenase [uncultured Maritimibacter sp.]|jgi:2-polyprenyl-6-methoxyphenol hydroxylase-like FAD-dependent oxidoreductase|uniref:FAD-dependent monooxygenase n=1 Tax=uncultured Maritimibacter sp. TaxID=991866 RepID=UPI000AE137CF|nr:FAD-dependent monooxygenase [uncultured Maritimibacter sp.]